MGQGRNHALTLAREGAAVIGLDLWRKPTSTPYDGAAEFSQTVVEYSLHWVEIADVGDPGDAVRRFPSPVVRFPRGLRVSHRDIVLPNARICVGGLTWEISEQAWQEVVDINLTGAWRTAKAVVPALIAQDGMSYPLRREHWFIRSLRLSRMTVVVSPRDRTEKRLAVHRRRLGGRPPRHRGDGP